MKTSTILHWSDQYSLLFQLRVLYKIDFRMMDVCNHNFQSHAKETKNAPIYNIDRKAINNKANLCLPCGWSYEVYKHHTLFYEIPESRCDMPIVTVGINNSLKSWGTYYGWTTKTCKLLKDVKTTPLSTLLAAVAKSEKCKGLSLPNAEAESSSIAMHQKIVCSQSNVLVPQRGPPKISFEALRSIDCEIFISAGKQCEKCARVEIDCSKDPTSTSNSPPNMLIPKVETPAVDELKQSSENLPVEQIPVSNTDVGNCHQESNQDDCSQNQPQASVHEQAEIISDIQIKYVYTKSQKLEESLNFNRGFVANFNQLLTHLTSFGKHYCIHVPVHNKKLLEAVYFQKRRTCFSQNPEILIIHKACEIPSTGVTIYALINVNKSGKLCIVCLWFIRDQCSYRIGLLMDIFKKFNFPWWQDIKVIMPAMDIEERTFLMSKLPQAVTFTCQYHALQGFQREIASQKCFESLSDHQIQICSASFKAMCLAPREDQYCSYLEKIQENVDPNIFQHFRDYWEPVIDQWADRLKPKSCFRFDNSGSDMKDLDVQIGQICMAQNSKDFLKSLRSLLESNLKDAKSSSAVATTTTDLKLTGHSNTPDTTLNSKPIPAQNDVILPQNISEETAERYNYKLKRNAACRSSRKRKKQRKEYNTSLVERYEEENLQMKKVIQIMENEKIVLKQSLSRMMNEGNKELNTARHERSTTIGIADGSSESKKASVQLNTVTFFNDEANTDVGITILHDAKGDIVIE